MTYTVGAGKSFNMVLSHPDDTDPSTWDQTTALSDMKREFQGWDTRYVIVAYVMTSSDTCQTSKDYQHDRKDHQVAAREW
jgi:hypothetical protein